MAKYKRKHIGGAPAFAIKLLLVICALGLAAALLAGCGAAGASSAEPSESEISTGTLDGSEMSEDSPTYVEVPGSSRRGDVFDFSYTTTLGTTVTCVVYDRSGDPETSLRQGGAGIWCFEEAPDGGMIAPLPRPQR